MRSKKTRGFKKDGLLIQLFKEMEAATAETGDDDHGAYPVLEQGEDSELGMSFMELTPLGEDRYTLTSKHQVCTYNVNRYVCVCLCCMIFYTHMNIFESVLS